MTKDIFNPALESARHWLHEIMAALELAPLEEGRGLHALRAGLHAIRDRLPAVEVVELGAQLPVLVRGLYYDGWKLGNDPSRIRTKGDMIARVQHELISDPRLANHAEEVLGAVIDLLVLHVSRGEIDDVVSTLPRQIATLWEPHLR